MHMRGTHINWLSILTWLWYRWEERRESGMCCG